MEIHLYNTSSVINKAIMIGVLVVNNKQSRKQKLSEEKINIKLTFN